MLSNCASIPRARSFTWRIQCADSERIPWIDVAWHDKFILHGAGYEGRYQGGLTQSEHGAYSDDYITTEVLSAVPPWCRRRSVAMWCACTGC